MTSYLNENFDLSDKNVVSVFDEFPLWSSYFGAVLLDLMEYRKNMTVLDIGCGTGFPLIELAQRIGSSSKIYGIDTWTSAAARIDLKVKTMNLNNVIFLNQPAEILPFRENTFDLIVSNNGINNVQDPDKVLSECARTLKTGGTCIMSMNLPGTMMEFYKVFKDVLKQSGLEDCVNKVNLHIKSKRKSIIENTGMIMKQPFCIEQVVEKTFFMKFADGSAFFNHYFIKIAFLESWKNIVPEEKRDEVFGKIEEKLNIISEKEGQLNLTIPFAVFKFRKSLENTIV